jgi:hypothetical protein
MKPISRVFHDNSQFSQANYKLENSLRITTLSFLNHWLIPSLMLSHHTREVSLKALKIRFMDQVVKPYVRGSYTLGANYVARIADREITSSTDDSEKISDIMVESFDGFWDRIYKLMKMERSDNRKGYQFIAEQKEIISNEFASQASWKAFNQGIILKGNEYKSDLAENNRLQLDILERDIRTEDLKGINHQLIYMDRRQDNNRERTSQTLPISMPRFEAALRARQELKGELVLVLVTQRDENVCQDCRDLETEFWLSGDPNIPDVPVHPNCRCRLALAENEFEQ